MSQKNPVAENQTTRRDFIRQAGMAAAAATIVPRYVLGGPRFVPPSEKVNVAIIGVGGQGLVNTRALFDLDDVQIVAVADVMETADYSKFYYGGTAGRLPAKALIEKKYGRPCTAYTDFREMLKKEKAIDAVLVATPDHVHPIATLEAIKHGKHVYCEKPLSRSVHETRMMAKAAREAGVATQMGNQGHSGDGIRMTVEWIRDGAIGPIKEVKVWSSFLYEAARFHGRPPAGETAPKELNWDLWLGPAAKRPFHSDYAPYMWRGWWDFGTGALGDMGCHNIDPAIWALDLHHPDTIEARSVGNNEHASPYAAMVKYSFPARTNLPPVEMTWYSGMPPFRTEELGPGNDYIGNGNGIMFIGEKGKLMCAGWAGSPRFIPITATRSYKKPKPTLARSNGHHRDWIDACKGGKPASSNFDYAARLTEIVALGNVAIRANDKLTWDGKTMRVTNNNAANQFITPEYHNGWSI